MRDKPKFGEVSEYGKLEGGVGNNSLASGLRWVVYASGTIPRTAQQRLCLACVQKQPARAVHFKALDARQVKPPIPERWPQILMECTKRFMVLSLRTSLLHRF